MFETMEMGRAKPRKPAAMNWMAGSGWIFPTILLKVKIWLASKRFLINRNVSIISLMSDSLLRQQILMVYFQFVISVCCSSLIFI
jgi:hypothetical protein